MRYLSILFLLSSCIFQSVERDKNFENIEVVIKYKNEPSFIMQKNLEKKFNLEASERADFKLTIDASSEVKNSVIVDSSSFTVIVTVQAKYKLVNVKTGKQVFESAISISNNFTSGSDKITADYVQTKQIIKNLSNVLAEDIYRSINENAYINSF